MADQIAARARKIVLIVDETPERLEEALSQLAGDEYEVLTASNAAEARHQMDQLAPDLMLLRLRLPDAAGVLHARRCSSSGRRLSPPVVLLGSARTPEELETVYGSGALSHVLDDAGAQRLTHAVETAFERLEFEGDPD